MALTILLSESEKFFPNLSLRKRVLMLMKSEQEFGGPQDVQDVCESLGVPNSNVRSVLVRMKRDGLIERVQMGVYRIKGDTRPYKIDKPHYGG